MDFDYDFDDDALEDEVKKKLKKLPIYMTYELNEYLKRHEYKINPDSETPDIRICVFAMDEYERGKPAFLIFDIKLVPCEDILNKLTYYEKLPRKYWDDLVEHIIKKMKDELQDE